MKKMIFLAVLASLLVSSARAGERQPKSAVNLLFLGIARPMVIRLQVDVDNRSPESVFRGYIQKWVNYIDRDGDGALNSKELKLMPNAKDFSQLLRTGYYYNRNNKPMTMSDFGKLDGDNITSGEILNHYRRNGVEVLQITGGNVQGISSSGVDRLFEVLDSDRDDKLSKQELTWAPKIILNLDVNDNEYLDLEELGQIQPVNRGGINYQLPLPGQGGVGKPNLPDAFSLIPKGSPAQFSLLLLSRYDKNKDTKISRLESGLAKRDFDRIDGNRDNKLDVSELIGMVRTSKTMPVDFHLGKRKGNVSMVALDKDKSSKSGIQVQLTGKDTLHLILEEAKITVRGVDHGNEQMMMMGTSTAHQILRQQFRLANPKNKPSLTIADINGGRFQFLVNLFPMVDRNRDGKITLRELDSFADLQAEAKNYQLVIQITEDGRGLSQLLDSDRDGKLSQRELMQAWKSLEQQDRNKDGYLSANEIAKQYAITLTRGQPTNRNLGNLGGVINRPSIGKGAGPSWFQKMDVNGDRDVSRREFLGTQADFVRLDLNRDGLIDAREAAQATIREAKK